jgi:hypothetical protein
MKKWVLPLLRNKYPQCFMAGRKKSEKAENGLSEVEFRKQLGGKRFWQTQKSLKRKELRTAQSALMPRLRVAISGTAR